LSVSPTNFFVAGISVSYAPHFISEEANVKGAWHYGAFVNFFLPLWDLN
jgi:hypothetical protein